MRGARTPKDSANGYLLRVRINHELLHPVAVHAPLLIEIRGPGLLVPRQVVEQYLEGV